MIPARVSTSPEPGGAAEVLLRRARVTPTLGGLARPIQASAARASGSARSSSSSRSARGAGACASHGAPDGETPLPPYITEPLADPARYQTVYAREPGSAAAPTAGLHFTPELLARLDVERVTLHVGLDTFRPIAADDLDEHALHGERYAVARRGVGADRARPGA